METQEIRKRLELILGDNAKLEKSAAATFKQFDRDHNGMLDFDELRELINRLIENLRLPPVDDRTLSRVVRKYDMDESDSKLDQQEFVMLYRDLLGLIRDKYYPTKRITIRRDLFVGKRKLSSSQKFEDLFIVGKRLGAGCFGEVRLVTDIANKLSRVCKTVSKERVDLPAEQICAEIDCMVALDHPNVIKIYEVLEDRRNVYIIMEQCEGGEMMAVITQRQKRTERQVARWVQQILEAIAYSHDRNIVHKDLKPENVMFQVKSPNSVVKVIDFGVAECFKPSQRFSEAVAGTPLYLAPEEYSSGICGKKVDCWAVGCIAYLLLTGKFPFYANTQASLKNKVLKQEPNYDTECKHISSLALDFLKRAFIKNPRQRPTARDLLRHEWFSIAPQVARALTVDICDNLSQYVRQGEAKSTLMNFLIHQMPCSNSQILKLAEMFKTIDKEERGYLAVQAFERSLVEQGVPQFEARRIVDTLENPNEPGVIHYTTFLAACFDYEDMQLDIIWSAFNKIDTDGDGQITTAEFCALLGGDSANLMTQKEIEKFVEAIDSNHNEVIEWNEFLDAMKKSRDRAISKKM